MAINPPLAGATVLLPQWLARQAAQMREARLGHHTHEALQEADGSTAGPAAGQVGSLQQLFESGTDGDLGALRQAAHAIRGGSATIGALQLADMARALEQAAPWAHAAALQTQDISAVGQPFLRELKLVLASISAFLAHNAPSQAPRRQDALTPTALDHFAALLAAGDYEATCVLRASAEALRQQFGDKAVNEHEAGLGAFDYERAMASLQAMRADQPA